MHSRRRPSGSLGQRISISFVPGDVVDVHGAAEGDGNTLVEGRQVAAHLDSLFLRFQPNGTTGDAAIGKAEMEFSRVWTELRKRFSSQKCVCVCVGGLTAK